VSDNINLPTTLGRQEKIFLPKVIELNALLLPKNISRVNLNKSQKDIVESSLDFYFDYADGIIADKITDDIKAGKIKVYDESEVYDNLGIDIESIEN